jgi:hypothetical protein
VAGGAEGGMGGVEQGVTPDEKQPDTAQTAARSPSRARC